MTREEAIQILSTRDAHDVLCGYTSGVTEALDMAIEALSKPNYETDTEVSLAVTNRKKEKVVLWDSFGEVEYVPSADAVPTVIRAKTFMRKEDFDKWANEIKKQGKNIVCISCDAELENGRPHGEWIKTHEDGHGYWVGTCNNCGKYSMEVGDFCPNCGADMRETK